MRHIRYLLLTLTLISITACNSTKEPKEKEVVKENNTTKASMLGVLSKKQKIVKKELDIYLNELSTFNTDAIVDMTYPKLFYVTDLDIFRQYIASMQNSTDLEFLLYETNITKLSNVTTFSNGTEFTQAEYTSKIKIQFLKSTLYNTEEKMNFLYDALIHKYGIKNIHIDTKERILSVTKLEKVLIIKEKDKELKFLGNDKRYTRYYPDFLPLEILKIINKEE